MDRDRLLLLIDKYLSNQCSPEESLELEAWYRGYDSREDYLSQLSETSITALSDKMLTGIHNAMDQKPTAAKLSELIPANITAHRQLPAFRKFMKIAILVGLVFAAALSAYFLLPAETKKYETAYGEKNTITLPDGSKVVLNGHSTLRSNSNWSTSSAREVWLDGEAFFSVTHMKNNQRFVVHTSDGLSIEVLGTSFNVKKRGSNTQVVLREGKIRLHMMSGTSMDSLTMKPGDLVEINGQNKSLTREVVEPEKYTSWQNPNITFSNTPLREVLKMVQEVYGDETFVTDVSLSEKRISGSLPNDNLDILLKALEETLNCRIEHNNNRITVSKPK